MDNNSLSDKYILIVDDIPANLKVLGNTLHNLGYKFEFSTNGPSALQWLERKRFHLVLLDIMMPEMDGLEVCRRIRQKNEWNTIPVLFLTAKNDKESIVEGFRAGGQDYITKPFDIQELAARVHTHIELSVKTQQLNELNATLEATVLRRTQELAHANAELQQLDAAKNGFLKIISHEIRTPLNGIIGPLQIISSSNKNEELNRWLSMLHVSAERLERFALLALRITELQTAAYTLHKTHFPLLAFLRARADKCAQPQRLDIGGIVTDHTLYADKELMAECIDILLENALKHSPPASTVTLRSTQAMGGHAICIEDCGKGFSENQKKMNASVFSNCEDHIDSNTGLPLKIVALAAAQHGGELRIHSKQHGSIVEIWLPESPDIHNAQPVIADICTEPLSSASIGDMHR